MAATGQKGLVPSNFFFEFENSLSQCRALFDYQPQQDEELPLEKDCIVTILDNSNADWWRGIQ